MIGHFDLKFILNCDSYSLCHMRCLWEFKAIFICQNWLTKSPNLQMKNTDSTKLGKLLLKVVILPEQGHFGQIKFSDPAQQFWLKIHTLSVPCASMYSETSIIWTSIIWICFSGSRFSWTLRSYFRIHSKTFILHIMWWNSKHKSVLYSYSHML